MTHANGYMSWCGITNDSGIDFDGKTVKIHEQTCLECRRLKSLASEYAKTCVIVNSSYRIIKRSELIKEIKEKFGISTMKASSVVQKAYEKRVGEMLSEKRLESIERNKAR